MRVSNSPDNTVQTASVSKKSRALTVVGIILCVILVPILAVNCTLIIKGSITPDSVPSFCGYIPLIVKSGSMHPTIPAGSLIICREADPQEVKKDYIIAFFDPESRGKSIVTHQVAALEREIDPITGEAYTVAYKTKGEANDIGDRLAVPTENLVGVYVDICFPGIGALLLFMQTTVGMLICVFVPIGGFIAYEVLRRKKADRAKQGDIEALRAELAALKAGAPAQTPAQEESDPPASPDGT